MRNTMIKKLLLNGGKYETVQGVPPLILEKSLGKNLKDYKLYGNSFQNGTPTPDTPVEVESVGEYDEATGKYKIPVVASGRNLYQPQKDKLAGVYSGLDMSGWEQTYYTLQVILKEGKTIPSGVYFGFLYRNSSANWLVQNGVLNTSIYGNPPTNAINTSELNGVCCYPINKLDAFIDAFDVMLVKGKYNRNTMPPYEPYIEPIETNIYLDEPLRKAGTVADYIDFENSMVIRNIKRADLIKSDSVYVWKNTNGAGFPYPLDDKYFINKNAVSNRANQFNQELPNPTSIWIGVNSAHVYWIGILDYLGFTTFEELNVWLTENPTYIYYATKHPTEELIELPQLPTLKGTTVLDTKTNLALSNMSVVYKRR